MKKSDRRSFLDTCVKAGADRNASLAATEALESAACSLRGCQVEVDSTVVVRTLYEPREDMCDAARNHVQEKGSASVYCDPPNRCSTTCGKARSAKK